MWLLAVGSELSQEQVGQALRRRGDRVLAVHTAHEAWHLLACVERHVSTVMISMHLERESGLGLARDLREDYPDLNVVLLTSEPAPVEDTEFPLLVEPFSLDDVRSVLAM
jgi:ActR/RegA family two-component response regulator